MTRKDKVSASSENGPQVRAKARRVMLIGSFSGGNFGDSLVLSSALQTLGRELGPDTKYVVPTSRPGSITPYIAGAQVETIDLRWKQKHGVRFLNVDVVRELSSIDLICTTAGILFDRRLLNPHHNFISTLLPILWWSRYSKTRVFGLNVGVSPPTNRIGRYVLKKVLSYHHHIATRDSRSAAVVRHLADGTSVSSHADLAFAVLESMSFERGTIREERNLLGINVASYLDAYDPTREGRRIDQLSFIRELANNLTVLLKNLDLQPCFVSTTKDDASLHQTIAAYISGSAKHVRLHDQPIENAVSTFREMRLFIATRMHACILATEARVPTIALTYDAKVLDFMKQIGCEKWAFPVQWAASSSMVDDVMSLNSAYEGVRNHLLNVMPSQAEKARSSLKHLHRVMSGDSRTL